MATVEYYLTLLTLCAGNPACQSPAAEEAGYQEVQGSAGSAVPQEGEGGDGQNRGRTVLLDSVKIIKLIQFCP